MGVTFGVVSHCSSICQKRKPMMKVKKKNKKAAQGSLIVIFIVFIIFFVFFVFFVFGDGVLQRFDCVLNR
ncbi:hypothetical protein SAMN04487975_10672 [Planococcus glaciei]|nr:hypothetical protein SAMN04487975_10672 [Planococcus glaciei]